MKRVSTKCNNTHEVETTRVMQTGTLEYTTNGLEANVHPDNTHLSLNLSLHSTQYNVKWQFGNNVQDSAYVICRSHRT